MCTDLIFWLGKPEFRAVSPSRTTSNFRRSNGFEPNGFVNADLIRVKWNFASLWTFPCPGRVKVIMKIAQVAPLIESVPPRLYGGTERIASYLTEELVRLGHGVTLFAIEDSITNAELAPCCTIAMASSHDQALALSQLRGAWAPATPHSRRPS